MALPHIPLYLCIGKVDDSIVCQLCQGVLREPRFSASCSDHAFCRVCYEDALRNNAHCPHPSCNIEVEGVSSLVKFGPFEDVVNKTELRCPNSVSSVAAAEADAAQAQPGLNDEEEEEEEEEKNHFTVEAVVGKQDTEHTT
ncbi:hypothetical protein T484DRAFT_1833360 [Baffinella frigidus]|nr:hypothetical protein T484DRAFT_1833360 [Cryptophyta sp. CCMP2293]